MAVSERTDAPEQRGWNRRTWTVLFSFGLVIVFALVGVFVRVPYVAVGPGPTFDTLGKHKGSEVIDIGSGPKQYPTDGQLRMVTISITDNLSLFSAMGFWLSGRESVAPRDSYIEPGQSRQQVDQENTQEFQNSQSAAELSALRYLKYPVKVLANTIVNGGPADKKLNAGDQIVRIGNTKVTNAQQVYEVMRKTKPGQTMPVLVESKGGGKPHEVRIKLGKNPNGGYGFLGLQPTERADTPFKINIRLNDVGGPSAGLIFALSIVDKLSPGQLTDGKTIAGTGTIDQDGEVGMIGGINFKLTAAKEQGANTFLVPAGNCTEAKATAPDGMRLIKVNTLEDAITQLHNLRDGKQVSHC